MTSTKANPAENGGALKKTVLGGTASAFTANESRPQVETSRLTVALDYAAQGWAVFPCQPGAKEPATRRGFHDATTNPATIRRWWLAQPEYNIGIATGLISRVWVFDIDGADGAARLFDIESRQGPPPPTLCSTTSNGCHLWFRAVSDLRSSTGHHNRLGPGLDVRADGGYVVAPPSVHPDGPIYRWSNSLPPAPAPDWLIQLARAKPPPALPISQRAISARGSALRGAGFVHQYDGAYGTAALDREINALVNTPPGARNHALNRASFSLHQLVAGGELDGATVRNRLIAAAEANGLMADPNDGPRKVALTIRSGARAGMQRPRNRQGAA
jgi:hypothetical protein